MIRHRIFACLATVLILSSTPFLLGQAVNATLLGTITDSTGATVANANVTATEATTGVSQQSVSNASGNVCGVTECCCTTGVSGQPLHAACLCCIQDNASLFKSFGIFRESALELRIEAFQLSNTPQFNNPNSGSGNVFTSGNFGRVTSTLSSGQGSVNGVGGGRTLQASARITF